MYVFTAIEITCDGVLVEGSTPLCEAVRQGQVEIVKVLLEFGARAPPHHHLLHYAVLHRQVHFSFFINANGHSNAEVSSDKHSVYYLVAIFIPAKHELQCR